MKTESSSFAHFLSVLIKSLRIPTVFDVLTSQSQLASPKFLCRAILQSPNNLKSVKHRFYTTVAWSIRMPAPMVLETEIFFKNTPLAAAGLALLSASTSAAKLPCNCSTVNEARPIVQ